MDLAYNGAMKTLNKSEQELDKEAITSVINDRLEAYDNGEVKALEHDEIKADFQRLKEKYK